MLDSVAPGPAAPLSPAGRMLNMIHGYLPMQLIYVAAKLGVADLLSSGPQRSADLAGALGVQPAPLHRVLRGLVNYEVLREEPDGRFALTPLGEKLQTHVAGSLRGLAIIHGEAFYEAYRALLHEVRTGEVAFNHIFGEGFFEYLAHHPATNEIFNNFISSTTSQAAQAMLAAYDFAPVRRVVDVGGTYGTFLAPVLQAHPHLQGVLFDKAAIVEGTELYFEAAGLADRCTIVAGDFLESVPAGGDLYILSQVLHDWDDPQATRILQNCRQALAPGGKLLIVEMIMPERVTPGAMVAEFDLHMLVLFDGRERSEAEYRRLLAAAGFALSRVIPMQSPRSLIEAVPG
ncbi:MAG TPA: methyltransferase [Chloroflexia bacterium]|nr:methyltransferase [Chloroflexia bacterium]